MNKQASGSNQYSGRKPSYAVDGNSEATDLDACATCESLTGIDNAWWQVDLGDVYLVTSVTLFTADETTLGKVKHEDTHIRNIHII